MFLTLTKYGRVSEEKVALIYNGISQRKPEDLDIKALKEKLGIPEGKKILLSVGRHTKQKRFDLMIKIHSNIIKKNSSCCLLLVGDGPDSEYLRKQSRELHVENSVFFLGFRRDVPDLLSLADVYICTSEWEAFSISILEVMASRKPIVAFDVDGVNEAITNEHNGYLIPFGDEDGVACHVVHLLNDDRLMKSMGQKGYDRFLKEFSINKNISETLKLYDMLTANIDT